MLLSLQICFVLRDFILSLSNSHQVNVIEAFNSISIHLDDLPQVASAAHRSKAVVLVLLVHCLLLLPLFVGVLCLLLFLLRSPWCPF